MITYEKQHHDYKHVGTKTTVRSFGPSLPHGALTRTRMRTDELLGRRGNHGPVPPDHIQVLQSPDVKGGHFHDRVRICEGRWLLSRHIGLDLAHHDASERGAAANPTDTVLLRGLSEWERRGTAKSWKEIRGDVPKEGVVGQIMYCTIPRPSRYAVGLVT